MMRSSVVLPEPDGPEQRQQLARGDVELTSSSAAKRPEPLGDVLIAMLIGRTPSLAASEPGARRVRSRPTLTTRVRTASSVSTDATANDPGRLYSWNSFSTRSGMVSVWPAMWPETT